ncbi:MAG: SPOR domain-containing protein [Sulfurovaceae bacterium]|nr:SPOR domain-containing protein [Sulfurovaceae bacterium]
MESKNLNDIVIEDTDNSKKAQLKNILTLLALLFIILVISIVITKLILGSDEDNNTTSLSSETTTQTENTGSNLSTAATVATGVAAGAATAAIVNHTTSSSDTKKETTTTTVLPDRNSSSSKKLPLRDHQPKKNITHRTHTTSHVTHTNKHVVSHRNEYTPTKNKKVVHKAPVKHTHVKATTKGYYIKVGSFKDPSTAIKRVKANHLKYKTIDTKNGTTTRVLVGPYYSQKEAQKDMATVRAHIAKDAFITKMP